MGKKVADVVNGMLSTAGSAMPAPAAAQTDAVEAATPAAVEPRAVEPTPSRTPVGRSPQPQPRPAHDQPAVPAPSPVAAAVPPAPTAATSVDSGAPAAPRTLRLRPDTAGELRAAWLIAKRDDVLLTAQDFASDLVDEALRSRRRRTRASA